MSRFEETNDIIDAISKQLNENGADKRKADVCMSYSLAYTYLINTEIAKSLAQLADDIHFLRETMAKEKEEAKERSKLTCGNCKYSYVIDHIDTGFLTRFNVEFCHRRDAEVDFRFTPICKHFEQKEEEAES